MSYQPNPDNKRHYEETYLKVRPILDAVTTQTDASLLIVELASVTGLRQRQVYECMNNAYLSWINSVDEMKRMAARNAIGTRLAEMATYGSLLQ